MPPRPRPLPTPSARQMKPAAARRPSTATAKAGGMKVAPAIDALIVERTGYELGTAKNSTN